MRYPSSCAILFFLLASSCGGTDLASTSSNDAQLFGGTAGKVVDTAVMMTSPGIYRPQITYSETESFDRTLNAAMNGETPAISVTVEPFLITPAELEQNETAGGGSLPRIHPWLWKIHDTDGQVLSCDEPPPEARRMIGVIVALVIGIVADIVHEYMIYKPAANYHARAIFDRDSRRLKRVEFVRRDQVDVLLCTPPLTKT